MGILDKIDAEIDEINASTASKPLTLDVLAGNTQSVQQYEEGKFICSLADISVYRKVDLQDTDACEKTQNNFYKLCSK